MNLRPGTRPAGEGSEVRRSRILYKDLTTEVTGVTERCFFCVLSGRSVVIFSLEEDRELPPEAR
jgi:hypothetical protein